MFGAYVAHVEKARRLSGLDGKWKTKAVATVGRGLARAGDRSFSPMPAVSEQQQVEIVSAKGWGDEFATLA